MMNETDPRATDRAWRRRAAIGAGSALVLAALFGFVILPIAQGSQIGIDAWTAICRALGINAGSPAIQTPVSEATAAPVSQVAWTAEIIDRLGAAGPEAGAVAAELCAGCHGDSGVPVDPTFPSIAGQSALAIYKQMHDFRSGSRASDVMMPIAQELDDQAIVDVSAFYAAQTKGTLDPNALASGDDIVARLINEGDPTRGIAACVSCHGTRAGGPIETPTIAGQTADYIAAQLRAYAAGTRANDVYGRMRSIAARLTEAEIDQLAAVYAAAPMR